MFNNFLLLFFSVSLTSYLVFFAIYIKFYRSYTRNNKNNYNNNKDVNIFLFVSKIIYSILIYLNFELCIFFTS